MFPVIGLAVSLIMHNVNVTFSVAGGVRGGKGSGGGLGEEGFSLPLADCCEPGGKLQGSQQVSPKPGE